MEGAAPCPGTRLARARPVQAHDMTPYRPHDAFDIEALAADLAGLDLWRDAATRQRAGSD